MATVGEIARLADELIAQAKEFYGRTPMPETFAHVHPLILREARRRCEGDWRRCVLNPDGTITVHDKIMWLYEAA